MSKDEDLKIGRRGSPRTRTFLEDNNTGYCVIGILLLAKYLRQCQHCRGFDPVRSDGRQRRQRGDDDNRCTFTHTRRYVTQPVSQSVTLRQCSTASHGIHIHHCPNRYDTIVQRAYV